MAAFSSYLEQKILNWIKSTAFGTAPASVYIALFSTDPTNAGSGTEVTATVRVAGRLAASFGTVSTSGSGASMSNSAIVDFGVSAGAVTITHFALYDAASAGNLIMFGPLTVSKTLAIGDSAKFNTGDLTLTVS